MDEVIKSHKKEYGCKPDVVVSAPGRFHLMGEHTWFFRDKTLSMGINLPVYVALSLRKDSELNMQFVQMGEKSRAGMVQLKIKKEDRWTASLKAVLLAFADSGYECSGMDVTIWSEVLPSAGFGITSAIKVAFTWAVGEVFSFKCSDSVLLKIIEKANRKYLSLNNLKADNFTAVYSKEDSLLLTDYSTGSCENIPFSLEGKTVVLTDAEVPRIVTWNEESLFQPENVLLLGELKELRSNVYGGWQYEENRSEIAEVFSVVNEDTKRRLTCVMQEHKNVLDAVNALMKNDFSTFARSVNKSHEVMRDLYDISCPEIDWLLKRLQDIAPSHDYIRSPESCGRITGKGFGRCTYSILRNEDLDKYREKLAEYERIFGFSPKLYEVKPARGVQIL
ncbi:galactokinase family protein [Treponema sp.]|uniref:galactokinase n=1 Tax=Treponema sp. TaxID=166 RepID=UPI0025FF40A4|nr:galactokinase family protein [Treponema sp.]MCR5218766.1 galactokinase [Treponema sp.]